MLKTNDSRTCSMSGWEYVSVGCVHAWCVWLCMCMFILYVWYVVCTHVHCMVYMHAWCVCVYVCRAHVSLPPGAPARLFLFYGSLKEVWGSVPFFLYPFQPTWHPIPLMTSAHLRGPSLPLVSFAAAGGEPCPAPESQESRGSDFDGSHCTGGPALAD